MKVWQFMTSSTELVLDKPFVKSCIVGGKNGGPLTVLASGLKGHEFGRDAREQELRCELCWSVDMEAPGCAIRIERGEKRSDDSVPDQLNEGNHMPPDWEEDK